MFDQFRELARKLEGHYAYYGITGNGPSLNQVRSEAVKRWHKWLRRRSRAPGGLTQLSILGRVLDKMREHRARIS
jgi:hypothetical protein